MSRAFDVPVSKRLLLTTALSVTFLAAAPASAFASTVIAAARARSWPPSGGSRRSVGRLRRSAPVAQLDRASVYGTEGRGFESLRAR